MSSSRRVRCNALHHCIIMISQLCVCVIIQSSTGSRFVADSLLECMEEEKMLAFSSLLQLEQVIILERGGL